MPDQDPSPLGGHRVDRPAQSNYATTRRAGAFLYVAGISGRRTDGSIPGRVETPTGMLNDVAQQADAAFENLSAALRSEGFGIASLVDVTCYLVDTNDYPAFVESWNRQFTSDPPTRTTLVVRQLPDPNLRIELKAVAYRAE